MSGATTFHPALDQLTRAVRRRQGQAAAVWQLARPGRSLANLPELLEEFETNDARLLINDMTIDTTTP